MEAGAAFYICSAKLHTVGEAIVVVQAEMSGRGRERQAQKEPGPSARHSGPSEAVETSDPQPARMQMQVRSSGMFHSVYNCVRLP